MKNKFSFGLVLLDVFRQSSGFLSTWLQRLGVATGLIGLIISTVDVVMYKFFRSPIRGSLDLVSFSLFITVASMGSVTLMEDKHLSIDFFVSRLPKQVQVILYIIVSFLGMVMAAGVTWYSVLYGRNLYDASERSATTNIPLFPFAYLLAFSFAVMCLVFLMQMIQSPINTGQEKDE